MEFVIYLYGDRLGMASIMVMTDDDYGSDDNGGKL
jgi:hypothetical protein